MWSCSLSELCWSRKWVRKNLFHINQASVAADLNGSKINKNAWITKKDEGSLQILRLLTSLCYARSACVTPCSGYSPDYIPVFRGSEGEGGNRGGGTSRGHEGAKGWGCGALGPQSNK